MNKLPLTLILLFLSKVLWSQCIATADGDWNNASTWINCSGGIPQDGDNVLIPDGFNITITEANQYNADGSAPLLHITLGDDDGDASGASLTFSGKLNLFTGSTIFITENSSTVASAPGESEKIRWWDSDDNQVGLLQGDDVDIEGEVNILDGILPVVLFNLKTQVNRDSVTLYWKTALELNNDHFEIEVSSDGLKFYPVVLIPGQGTTSSLTSYSFTDFIPYPVAYYRIKQVDLDGDFTLYRVLKVEKNNSFNIRVWPNPVSSDQDLTLSFTNSLDKPVFIEISNLDGKYVFSDIILTDNKYNIPKEVISAFSKGFYIVKINGSGVREIIIVFVE